MHQNGILKYKKEIQGQYDDDDNNNNMLKEFNILL